MFVVCVVGGARHQVSQVWRTEIFFEYKIAESKYLIICLRNYFVVVLVSLRQVVDIYSQKTVPSFRLSAIGSIIGTQPVEQRSSMRAFKIGAAYLPPRVVIWPRVPYFTYHISCCHMHFFYLVSNHPFALSSKSLPLPLSFSICSLPFSSAFFFASMTFASASLAF
jgi:hypothetical protein